MCMCLASPLASLGSLTRSFGWWYGTVPAYGIAVRGAQRVTSYVSESRTGVGRLNLVYVSK